MCKPLEMRLPPKQHACMLANTSAVRNDPWMVEAQLRAPALWEKVD